MGWAVALQLVQFKQYLLQELRDNKLLLPSEWKMVCWEMPWKVCRLKRKEKKLRMILHYQLLMVCKAVCRAVEAPSCIFLSKQSKFSPSVP